MDPRCCELGTQATNLTPPRDAQGGILALPQGGILALPSFARPSFRMGHRGVYLEGSCAGGRAPNAGLSATHFGGLPVSTTRKPAAAEHLASCGG